MTDDRTHALQQQTISLFAGYRRRPRSSRRLIGYVLKTAVAHGQPHGVIDNLNARIKAWWVMVLVIGCRVSRSAAPA